jgi:hypothetical protein
LTLFAGLAGLADAGHETGRAEVDRFRWLGRMSAGGGLRGVEDLPDLAGEVAFEAADRFAFGFAFSVFAIEVRTGGGVCASSGERR